MKTTQGNPAAARGGSRAGWVHFGIAAGLLLVAGVGLGAAVKLLGLHPVKAPVPPPAFLVIDDGQLQNFPRKLGPYELAVGLSPSIPEGIVKPEKDELATLGMNDYKDNWYYFAFYRDTRPGRQGRVVRLNITYYTGLLDMVPHIPDICLVAGGNEILEAESGPVDVTVRGASPPWNAFTVYRTVYATPGDNGRPAGKGAQYYFFSVNGQLVSSRADVRLILSDLWLSHAYYAKIQLAGDSEDNLQASDELCRDFLTHAMPEILRFLPSAADVEQLIHTDNRR